MIDAKIIADSRAIGTHRRITTFILTYPRFIHSELMTHRVFSRNAASSRAIPFSRMVKAIEENTAMPEVWGAEQKGMQSGDVIDDPIAGIAVWQRAMADAIRHAQRLQELGVHKSICNRLLEPFAHMTTIVTATEWDNFFHLRADHAAMPEFRILATKMLELYLDGSPAEKMSGEWHMPFGEKMPEGATEEERLAIASARCARLSYMTHDGEYSVEADMNLFNRLISSGHWSPLEHCATPVAYGYKMPTSNFVGWLQFRKTFDEENVMLGPDGLRRRLRELHA